MLKRSALTLVAAALVLAGAVFPASAQQSCTDQYNTLIAAYQSGSAQYAQLWNQYTASCAPYNPQHEGGSPMVMGTHNMPGTKAGTMSNQAMPPMSPNCSPEALATMPPEHRLACQRPPGG